MKTISFIYMEKIPCQAYAIPKTLPKCRIIKENDIPDAPIEYKEVPIQGKYLWKQHIVFVPYINYYWTRFWYPETYKERLFKRNK